MPWIWEQLNFSEKVASEETKKFRIACARFQVISNFKVVSMNSWYCSMKDSKRWITSAIHLNEHSSKVFAMSSYLKRYSFNKIEQ